MGTLSGKATLLFFQIEGSTLKGQNLKDRSKSFSIKVAAPLFLKDNDVEGGGRKSHIKRFLFVKKWLGTRCTSASQVFLNSYITILLLLSHSIDMFLSLNYFCIF